VSAIDPFARTDGLDPVVLDALIARFEARGRHPLFARMLDEYLDGMGLDARATVLDLGCGTGLAARAIARRPGFAGHVDGIDLSPHLIDAAQRLAAGDGLAECTHFAPGDARRVDVREAAYDAAVAHTLLSHVEDPAAVLAELVRVVRPGGVIGIFDGDYESLTFGHADPTQAAVFDRALVSAVVTNPRVMRQLPRLLRASGFELLACFPHVLAEAGTAGFWASAVDTYRKLLPQSGRMTAAEADAWAAALRRDSEAGVFFGSCNYYAYVARRR
jgi:ubiquinone/menaquinone biosynthesis C-methylase UbiE